MSEAPRVEMGVANPTIREVLENELQQVETSRGLRLGVDAQRPAADKSFVGLSFSGGGIRSATFNLGVLQALAKREVLTKFDYLSTVSGGGYIGSWLMAWMHHKRIGSKGVQDALRTPPAPVTQAADPPEVHFLRDYSNYLTPRRGVLGADLWAFLASYFRNMLLNQLILVLLLVSVLLLPRLAVYGLHLLENLEDLLKEVPWLNMIQSQGFATWAGLVLSWIAVYYIGKNLLTLEPACGDPNRRFAQTREVHRRIVLPLIAASAFFAYGFGQFFTLSLFTDHPLIAPAVLGSVLYGGLWAGALLFRGSLRMGERVSGPGGPPTWAMLLTAVITGAITGYLFLPYAHVLIRGGMYGDSPHTKWHVATYGTPALIGIMLAAGILHIGLLGRGLSDGYREWFARLGGWLVICSVVWLGIFAIAIYMPAWLSQLWKWELAQHPSHALTFGGILAWIGSTAYGVFFGKSPDTGVLSPNSPAKVKALHFLARIAPYVFVLGLLIGLSLLAATISQALTPWDATVMDTEQGCRVSPVGEAPHPSIFLFPSDCRFDTKVPLACLIFFLAAVAMSWRVDINQFSVHKLYRNRLVRCYLGASVEDRDPQPFTGFSSADDVPLASLEIPIETKDEMYGRPIPILNTSLNVVRGEELAMQTRKARSFICAPSYSGFTRQEMNGREVESAFARTVDLGKARRESPTAYEGLTLGTAMAISGAAASPNMGFYSTPALAFLMTVFDVRLGWWMGNPGCQGCETWEQGSPPLGFEWLLCELMGSTTDKSEYVYLSDGGHFENLAIYELVRRRCKLIVACDASCDSDYAFGDLHNAMERCRTDFGVEIEVDTKHLIPTGTPARAAAHFALGVIHYSSSSKDDGLLLYLKPTLLATDPADVLGYSTKNKEFPHDSTGNQWFDEALFENYRALGEAAGKAAGPIIATAVEQLFTGKQITPQSVTPEFFVKKP